MTLKYYVQCEKIIHSQHFFFIATNGIVCVCLCVYFSSLTNSPEYVLVHFENVNAVLSFAFYPLGEGNAN